MFYSRKSSDTNPVICSGGNAPVIAKRMAEEGADVLLGVQNTKV